MSAAVRAVYARQQGSLPSMRRWALYDAVTGGYPVHFGRIAAPKRDVLAFAHQQGWTVVQDLITDGSCPRVRLARGDRGSHMAYWLDISQQEPFRGSLRDLKAEARERWGVTKWERQGDGWVPADGACGRWEA